MRLPENWAGRKFAFLRRNKLLLRCNKRVACVSQQQAAGPGAAKRSAMLKTLTVLKKWSAIPVVKYSLISAASVLWLLGLADQIPDPTQMAKYVGISLLMAAVAAI
jgi:hypothetical protein